MTAWIETPICTFPTFPSVAEVLPGDPGDAGPSLDEPGVIDHPRLRLNDRDRLAGELPRTGSTGHGDEDTNCCNCW